MGGEEGRAREEGTIGPEVRRERRVTAGWPRDGEGKGKGSGLEKRGTRVH